jgi:glycine dehydrogenase subunit 2
MLTNPNTCGLFERDIKKIADRCTRPARIFYCDGANFNAIVGKVRPGDLGVDAMHINLHKTFSTPHGGGGPGAGRWCCPPRWRRSRRCRFIVKTADGVPLNRGSTAKARTSAELSAACARSTARWACSPARSPT